MLSLRRLGVGLVTALTVLVLAGCASSEVGARTLYVDGTRGCKQPTADVTLWAAPGAGAVDSPQVGLVPHGTAFVVLEEVSVYGIRYYRLAHAGLEGWLPESYMETIPPECVR